MPCLAVLRKTARADPEILIIDLRCAHSTGPASEVMSDTMQLNWEIAANTWK